MNAQSKISTINRKDAFLVFFLFVIATSISLSALAKAKEQVLYSFQGVPDGSVPVGGMVFDKNGNLYGATTEGGDSTCNPGGCGTVFELSPPAKEGDPWIETQLWAFKGLHFNDGAEPVGGLVMDGAGNLYGTTAYQGAGPCQLLGSLEGCGVVYELSPPTQTGGAWRETILYNFQGASDGFVPQGDLVFDSAGNLYGATRFGGGFGGYCNSAYYLGCGTIFELSKTQGTWTEKVLYAFKGIAPGTPVGDASEPNGSLVLDSAGNIYGTTYYGGIGVTDRGGNGPLCGGGVSGLGCGTVFELAPQGSSGSWMETTLHRFTGYDDGANPSAGLIFDENGNLYGTSFAGGYEGDGLAFEMLAPNSSSNLWTEKILLEFDPLSGSSPAGSLTLQPGGILYGTASEQGRSNGGTLFALQSVTAGRTEWSANVLYSFTSKGGVDPAYPDAKLVFDSTGTIYSSTLYGGGGQNCGTGGCGTVYEFVPK